MSCYWRESFAMLGLSAVAEAMLAPHRPPTRPEPLSRAEIALEVGEELLQEWTDTRRVRTVAQLAELRGVITGCVADAAAQDSDLAERRERARLWRERLPELAEATFGGQDERRPRRRAAA